MIKFNITTEENGDLSEVHVNGHVKGRGDIVAMEIRALLDNLEERCPLSLMTAISSKISEEGLKL